MATKNVVINIIAEVDDYERRLKRTGRFTEKQAAAMARKWERSLVDAQIKAGKAAQKSASTAKIAWGSALGVLSAGAITSAAKSLLSFTQDMADYRNEIADASVRTALAAETLAGLRLAAEGSGLGLQELNGAMLKFAKQGGDANENLSEFLIKLDQFETASEKAAFASKTLGEEAGPKLLQALGGSGEKLKDLTEFARDYGVNVAPEAAEASSRWQMTMALLDTQLQGTKDRIVNLDSASTLLLDSIEALARSSVVLGAAFNTTSEAVKVGIGFWSVLGTTMDAVLSRNFAKLKDAARAHTEWAKAQSDVTSGKIFVDTLTNGAVALKGWREAFDKALAAGGGEGGGSFAAPIVAGLEEVRGAITLNIAELNKMFDVQVRNFAAERLMGIARVQAKAKEMDEIRETEEKTIIDLDTKRNKSAMFGLQIAGGLADGVAAIASISGKKSKEAHQRAAIAQKAAAVFSIGVNTAMAIMQALGTLPPPAGFIAAGLAGVAGAVQAGVVLAKPIPAFHTGGVVTADLLEGEGVLNQRAVQNIGRKNIEALNNDTPAAMQGGPVKAVLAMNGRIMDRLVAGALRADGLAGRMVQRPVLATQSPYR